MISHSIAVSCQGEGCISANAKAFFSVYFSMKGTNGIETVRSFLLGIGAGPLHITANEILIRLTLTPKHQAIW